MGNTDSLPVVSQVKSGVQLIAGDTKGAARTQERFFHECPGFSQVTSTVQLISGDAKGALETQKRCGAIHYAVGDTEGGTRAMKSASRTAAVMGGGVGGFILGGPVGAVAGGICAGATADGTTTAVESVARGEYTPSGYVAAIGNAVSNPNAGDLFDLAAMPVFDGLSGYSAGQTYNELTGGGAGPSSKKGSSETVAAQAKNTKVGLKLEADAWAKLEQLDTQVNLGKITDGQYLSEVKVLQKQFSEAQALQAKAPVVVDMKQQVAAPVRQHVNPVSQQQVQVEGVFVPPQTSAADGTGSDDENDHEHEPVKLRVFYVNARSINPSLEDKMRYVKTHIARARPHVVAIVETWLTSRIGDSEVLSVLGIPTGYQLFRRDRSDVGANGRKRRGGGILIAIDTRGDNLSISEVTASYKDSFLAVKLQYTFYCDRCERTVSDTVNFGLIYRRRSKYVNGETREAFNNHSTEMWSTVFGWLGGVVAVRSKYVLVGDFNFNIEAEPPSAARLPFGSEGFDVAQRLLLGIPIYRDFRLNLPSRYERGIFTQLERLGLEQMVEDATHTDGNILDLIFCSPEDLVRDIRNMGNIAVTSIRQDHVILTFKVELKF